MNKNTKKNKKPTYTVDLSKIETLSDIDLEFAFSKFDARVPLDNNDLYAIVEWVAETAAPRFTFICECCETKKTPWYKKIWRKLFGKKNKK